VVADDVSTYEVLLGAWVKAWHSTPGGRSYFDRYEATFYDQKIR